MADKYEVWGVDMFDYDHYPVESLGQFDTEDKAKEAAAKRLVEIFNDKNTIKDRVYVKKQTKEPFSD